MHYVEIIVSLPLVIGIGCLGIAAVLAVIVVSIEIQSSVYPKARRANWMDYKNPQILLGGLFGIMRLLVIWGIMGVMLGGLLQLVGAIVPWW